MSALDIALNPGLMRAEATRLRSLAATLPPAELMRVRLNAVATEFENTADAIDALPPAARADFIDMLRSIRPN